MIVSVGCWFLHT